MIAFDGTGNLWVANGNFSGVNTVVDFTPSQLAASGTPAPTVVLSANSGSLGNPAGLAFDASGDLWVANVAGSLVEFTPSQLVTSGDPAPNATVTGTSLSGPFGSCIRPPRNGIADQAGKAEIATTGSPVGGIATLERASATPRLALVVLPL